MSKVIRIITAFWAASPIGLFMALSMIGLIAAVKAGDKELVLGLSFTSVTFIAWFILSVMLHLQNLQMMKKSQNP